MKKVIIPIVLLLAVVFGAYMLLYKNSETKHEKVQPIAFNSSDSLTGSVGTALQAYFNLKDAFIKSDTALANSSAVAFVRVIDSIQVADAKTDTAIVELANSLKQSVANETKNMITAPGLEAKRKVFQAVSDQMFDLVRSVGYNGSIVYQQYCPMAFNNNGAAWLSNTTEIINPYFGDKMLHCGDLRDSISNK